MVKRFAAVIGLALAGASALAGAASATVYFNENFNGYTNGSSAATQAGTGLQVLAFGDVPGWTKNASQGNIHAVNRGSGDYAVMFYDGNLIYYATPIAANTLNTSYTLSFDGAYGVYSSATQMTGANDYVTFLLRDSTGTVASYNYTPNSTAFSAASFSYIGKGTGALYLTIMDGNSGDGRFGGAIDNVVLADTATVAPRLAAQVAQVPEPASLAILGAGLIGAASLRRRKSAAV